MSSHPVPFLPTLPPPVTFYSTETLHRILLAPLAEFLSDLSSAEHLLRLHDILDRYRTPKSYHRIDVREVGSGELPWGDEGIARAGEGEKREKGREGESGERAGAGELENGGKGGKEEDQVEKAEAITEEPGKGVQSADVKTDGAAKATDPSESTSVAAGPSESPAAQQQQQQQQQKTPISDEEARWRDRVRGRPVVLPTEQDVQDYLANRDRPAPRAEVMDVTGVKLSGNMAIKTEATVDGTTSAAGLPDDADAESVQTQVAGAILSEHDIDSKPSAIPGNPDDDTLPPGAPDSSAAPPAMETEKSATTASATMEHSIPPQSPPTSHSVPERIPPRPPSPPRRRIRELRLDLRTLDAAALFQLEIWRREVLGLQKMDMEHPDSIWFHDPTPEPSPEPEPKLAVAKRPRGRPRKEERDVDSEGIEIEHSKGGMEGVSVDEPAIKAEGEATEGKESSIVPGKEGDVATVVSPSRAKVPEEDNKSPSRSPTPDQVLFDAYNEKEDEDPDFVPPATPPPRRRGPARGRKSAGQSATPIEPAQPAEPAKSPEYASTSSNKGRRTSSSVRTPPSGKVKQLINVGDAATVIKTAQGYVFPPTSRYAKRPRLLAEAVTPVTTSKRSTRIASGTRDDTDARVELRETHPSTNKLRPLRPRPSLSDTPDATPSRRSGTLRNTRASDRARSSRGGMLVAGETDSEPGTEEERPEALDDVDADEVEDEDEWGFLRGV